MRFFLSLFAFCILVNHSLKSQQYRYIGFELGGNGGLYSVNMERSLLKDYQKHWHWRYGISIFPNSGRLNLVVPLEINYLIGNNNHYAEIGFGQGIAIAWDYNWNWVHFFPRATGRIGYRWYSSNQKYFFSIAYIPLISYLLEVQYQNWFGVMAAIKLK